MNFGKTILELRKAKNVTQDEMAAELGVTAAAVSKWENGYSLPDILMLCALADYFGVTTDQLLGRNVERKFAVIAAETQELGQKIAEIAKDYGVITHGIFTDYVEAIAAGEAHEEVRYLLAGYHDGFYGGDCSLKALVSVSSSDQEILDGFHVVFEKYLD